MPEIKTRRNDILRRKEIVETLRKASMLKKPWGDALPCLITIAWLFGKRISEILKLKRQDIWVREGYLYIRFFVSKKKARKDAPVPKPYLKRITLKHDGPKIILSYIKILQQEELFPNMSRELAWYYLKKVNEKAWWHLFRESLATEMAERGATEEKLMHWFDWDRVDTAHAYVKRGTKLTEELSERTW